MADQQTLEKVYLSDAPSEIPRKDNIRYLKSIDDLLTIESALIYCDSKELVTQIRKYDKQGLIHLGCRGVTPGLMCEAPVLRFGTNYLMSSFGWDADKYKAFKKFKPANPVKLPQTHYLNINRVSDEEATETFLKQMKSIDKSPVLGIDFETNGFPEFVDFFPLGLSICDLDNSYYYDFDCYKENRNTRPKFYKALENYVEKNTKRLWAFNVSFEIRCFYFMYCKFFKLQDTRALCIVDYMKSNLKYGAQYYLQVPSWDDSVDEEMRALEEAFKLPLEEFDAEYKLGPNSKYDFVQNLCKFNKDNPDFLPRFYKYHGSTWACANQQTVGKYCCYDSVMDILIHDKIKSVTHVDHKYSDEAYNVYLANQYLSAIIDMSGIFVEPRLLAEENETFERIYFNTNLWLNKEMVKFKIEYLKKHCSDRIEVQLNDKLAYLVDELSSYIFIQKDRATLGKDFAKLVRGNQAVFDKLIDKHYDELNYLVTAWPDEEEFKKILRQRKLFAEIGEMLYDEWQLKALFEQYNKDCVSIAKCNRTAVEHLPYTDKEVREILAKGEKVWKQEITSKVYQYYLSMYIYDLSELHDAAEMESSLELRKYKALYNRMLPYFKGRTIYDQIDNSLTWMFIFEFNAPLTKELAGKLLQEYCQESYATFAGFTELCKAQNHPEWYTKKNYLNYVNQMKKAFPDLMKVPEYFDYYYDKIPIFATKTTTDKKTKQTKTFSYDTGKFSNIEKQWSLKTPTGASKGFPPCNIPIEHLKDPWTELDYQSLEDDFDVPAFNCHKFLGIYKLNRVVTKMMSTSIASLYRDSYNVKLLDESRGLKITDVHDEKKLTKYYIKAMANMADTNRWQANVHSVLAPTEDTRIALVNKMGTHFLLPRDNETIHDEPDTVYTIDGYNFRSNDVVKLNNGETKVVKDLTESDEFDKSWLEQAINQDKQNTGNVYWDYEDVCYNEENPFKLEQTC